MNQILDYNPNKSSGGGSSGSDKITRVFALILICFAICLVGIGGYNLYKNKKETVKPEQTATQAKIEVEQKDLVVKIKVSHDKTIEKLIYNWDSDKEMLLKSDGKSTMEEEIPLLAGTHTLNIKVIDVNGVESTYQQEFYSESGEDKIFPVIDLKVTDDKKLKIIATDETEIKYVTYRWNDEEEIQIDVSEEDNKKIEFDIDIYKGKNDIVIVAVDANNNSTTQTESFTGVTKPDVTVTISADKRSVDIKCFHENGIKEIELNINQQDYDVDLGGETPTDVTLPQIPLAEGNNTVKVLARSVDDTVTEVTEEVVSDVVVDEINIAVADDGNITVNVPNGIKEMKLILNNEEYGIDLGNEVLPEVNISGADIPFRSGDNDLTVKVISVNGTEKEETKKIKH